MAEDTTVATTITLLKAKWANLDGDNVAIMAPGNVRVLVPVDNTSAMPVIVPGRIIKLLGITKDVTGSKFDKIYEPKSTPSTNTNRRSPKTPSGSKNSKFVDYKDISITLKTPVSYKVKTNTRTLTKVRWRVPSVVSIDCITWYLWNAPVADQRPPTFETLNRIYRVFDIDKTKLGEMSDKVEAPEANQETPGPGATLQTTK